MKKISQSLKKEFPHRPKINKNSSAILKKAEEARDYMNRAYGQLDPELGVHGVRNFVKDKENPKKR
jgi:hypothetical protein